jgi:uncharacterized protein
VYRLVADDQTLIFITREEEFYMESINTVDRHGHTPLIDAAKVGDIVLVKDLLEKNVDLEGKSHKGKTALHYAAANGKVEVVRMLLQKGADANVRDKDWHTALMMAANYGCNETIQTLLDYGADVDAKTLTGNTAITYAEYNSHPDTANLLKKAPRK